MSIAEGGEEEQLEHDPSATEGNPSARGNSASPAEPDQEPEDEQQNPDPNQSPVGPYVPEYRCMITGGGNCYHTSLNCCTLHNTRTLRRSVWCPSCSLITDNERYGAAYIQRPGADAHRDPNCPALEGQFAPPYRHCQRCGRFPFWRPPSHRDAYG